MNFSSHNIVLPDGSHTAPTRPLVAGSGTCQAALRYLEEVFGPGPHDSDITVADVGCLEGGYAAEFARAGYDVTGIELRQENYDHAVWLKNTLMLPNLNFIHGDAWDALPGRQFDAVFCCGLLYHMASPVAFLNLLGESTRRLLILNTHFSMENGHPEDSHLPTGTWCETTVSQNEGRSGHWCHEEDDRYASAGGASSFWLRKDELTDAITCAGFAQVTETSDWLTHGNPMPWGSGGAYADRGMFVAVKS